MSSVPSCVLGAALICFLPGTAAAAQEADEVAAPAPVLQADEVARIGDVSIARNEYLRYVGTVYARLPQGEASIEQLLTEAVVQRAADAADIVVAPDAIDALAARLEDRARRMSGGELGLVEALGTDEDSLHDALALLALQEAVVGRHLALAPGEPPGDEQLRDWLAAALSDAALETRPLQDALAATWTGGSITRAALGERIDGLLTQEERAGVLTELLGILLIRAKATRLGVEFTPEVAAAEIVERERQVLERSGASGPTYADIVSQVQQLSMEELVATPRFAAEVLMRRMVEDAWDLERLRTFYERERASFTMDDGEEARFEDVVPAVWRAVRQRSYQQLFTESTIVRRF